MQSTASTTVSSRSSTCRLMNGCPMRAVTFQSMCAHVVAGLVVADLVEGDAGALEDGVIFAAEQVFDRPTGRSCRRRT